MQLIHRKPNAPSHKQSPDSCFAYYLCKRLPDARARLVGFLHMSFDRVEWHYHDCVYDSHETRPRPQIPGWDALSLSYLKILSEDLFHQLIGSQKSCPRNCLSCEERNVTLVQFSDQRTVTILAKN
jgi:hypothetical protein